MSKRVDRHRHLVLAVLYDEVVLVLARVAFRQAHAVNGSTRKLEVDGLECAAEADSLEVVHSPFVPLLSARFCASVDLNLMSRVLEAPIS